MAEEKIFLQVELPNIGEIVLELKKILSPITIERIIRILKQEKEIKSICRYFIGTKDIMMIKINIHKELERPVSEMKQRDVAYEAITDSFLIALKDSKPRSQVSILGRVVKGFELFEKIPRSIGCKITLV
ncbi:MAG: hypothetical protein ACTSRZ_05230 [Promethearchaeota archaeon]